MDLHHHIDSTAIRQSGYDGRTDTLMITFRSGQTVYYPGVPRSLYDGLNNAPSAGSYYHKHIRSQFNSTPTPPEPPQAPEIDWSRCSRLFCW